MTTPDKEYCPSCGAQVSGGRAGCQSLYDELAARAYSDPLYAAVQTLAWAYPRPVQTIAACLTHNGVALIF